MSRVVTPRATLAGTDRLSNQNETCNSQFVHREWDLLNDFQPPKKEPYLQIYICLIPDQTCSLNKGIYKQKSGDLPKKRWRACRRGRRLWGDSRRTLSWTPSGSANNEELLAGSMSSKYDQFVKNYVFKNVFEVWNVPWDSCTPPCWWPCCNRLSRKAPAWTWSGFMQMLPFQMFQCLNTNV